jgi:hypothetical protein
MKRFLGINFWSEHRGNGIDIPMSKDREDYLNGKYYHHPLAGPVEKRTRFMLDSSQINHNLSNTFAMVQIRKTGEGYYLAIPTSKDGTLSRNDCNQLKRELSLIIRSHREISIDVRGIKAINREGLKILQEMHELSAQKKCRLRYIHVDVLIQPHITRLTEKKVTHQGDLLELARE